MEERGWLACMLIIPPMGVSLTRGPSHVSPRDASILFSFSIGRLDHSLFCKGSQVGPVRWVSTDGPAEGSPEVFHSHPVRSRVLTSHVP